MKPLIAAGMAFAGLAGPAAAQDLPATLDEVVRVELLPGWRQADGTHIAALRFDLAKGWKTYWRSPGDGGLPTHIDHRASGNVADLQVIWPQPEVFRTRGVRSIGYRDEVILPLHLAPEDGADIDLDLSLSFGVCEDVCIPVRLEFKHQLTDQITAPDARIDAAIATRADDAAHTAQCSFSESGDGVAVTVSMHAPILPGRGEHLVIETENPGIWISEPDVLRDGEYLTAEAVLVSQKTDPDQYEAANFQVTLISSQKAVSYGNCAPQ